MYVLPGEQPNILWLVSEDNSPFLGCYGDELAITPNLDQLASEGVRFSQFYNAARCCPTRAALLTGLYPHQAGMGGMVDTEGARPEGAYQGYLNENYEAISTILGNSAELLAQLARNSFSASFIKPAIPLTATNLQASFQAPERHRPSCHNRSCPEYPAACGNKDIDTVRYP